MEDILISQTIHFNAAHKVHNPSWSEEQNSSVYGICANANYHGHNFKLTVSIRGKADPATGWVIDPRELQMLLG